MTSLPYHIQVHSVSVHSNVVAIYCWYKGSTRTPDYLTRPQQPVAIAAITTTTTTRADDDDDDGG